MTVNEFNASLDQFPANVVGRRFGLSAKQSYDLGLEWMFVEEMPAVIVGLHRDNHLPAGRRPIWSAAGQDLPVR
jgi:hypothetical protein